MPKSGILSLLFFLITAFIFSTFQTIHAKEKKTPDKKYGETGETPEIELPKMVVTGSREEVDTPENLPVPVQIITQEQIKEIGAIKFDQIIEITQGVELVNSPDMNISPGLKTLRMRGMDFNHVLILVNGKRLPGSRPGTKGYSYIDIGNINIDMIERIEVLRDGASAQYGSDAVAGVINIITKKYITKFSVNTQYGISSQDDAEEKHIDASGGFPLGKRLHLNLSAFGTEQDHYDRTPSDRWGSADYKQGGGNIGVVFDVTDFQMISLDGRFAETDSEFLKEGAGDGEVYRNNNKQNLSGDIDWEGEFENIKFDLCAGYSNSEMEYRHTEDPDYRGDMDWDVAQYNGSLTWDPTGWLTFFTGASWNKENIDSPQRNFIKNRTVKAIFTEIDLKPFYSFKLQLSGRFEHYSDFGDNFSPKLACRYEIISPLAIRASVSKSYVAPTLFQMHDNFPDAMGWNDIYGNPDLDASEGLNTTFGVVWKVFKKFKTSISLDYFYNQIEDMIVVESLKNYKTTLPESTPEMDERGIPATVNTVSSYKNLDGTTKYRGLELGFASDLLWGFAMDVNANYLDTEDPDGYDLTNRPRSGMTAILRYNHEDRFWGNLRYNYRGKYISDGLFEEVSCFDTINAQVNCAVTKNIVIYLGGRNLLDEKPPLDLEKYEMGHRESMIDSSVGAYWYGGAKISF